MNSLSFYDIGDEAPLRIVQALKAQSVDSLHLVGDGALADAVMAEARRDGLAVIRVGDIDSAVDGGVLVLTETAGARLGEQLLACVGMRDLSILAPVTDRHFSRRPLFLITIPKAGTHLIFELAKALGYQDGIDAPDFPQGQTSYCLEFTNTHTVARDFFVDSVRRMPFGGRHHAFTHSPCLFIYRHPLDILVSEAHYYHRDGKTLFAGWFDSLDYAQRVRLLVEDNWLVGSLRQRIGGFVPWLSFPNVIPLSFEELVGTPGGGSDELQQRLIWSIQLKLQVPGVPMEIAKQLFNPDSDTFRSGMIGGFHAHLPADVIADFVTRNSDLLEVYGYPGNGDFALPSDFERRINRPLGYSDVDHDEMPLTVENHYMDCNLVRYRGRFYAIPASAGVISLQKLSPEDMGHLPSAESLVELKMLLVLDYEGLNSRHRELARLGKAFRIREKSNADMGEILKMPEVDYDEVPVAVESRYMGCNLVRYMNSFYGIPMNAGPISLEQLSPEDLGCLPAAESLVELKMLLMLGREGLESRRRALTDLGRALYRKKLNTKTEKQQAECAGCRE